MPFKKKRSAREIMLGLEDKSDEEILALSVENPEIFGVLVDRYEHLFLKKGKSIFPGQEDEAEDAVQDTFVKIYLNADRFKVQEGGSFKAWAYKIFINTAFSRYKKTKREEQFLAKIEPEIAELVHSDDGEIQEKKMDADYLMSMISKLPNLLAKVLTLHIFEGKTAESIADMEGVSVGAIRARIHRAKKEVKKINLDRNSDKEYDMG
jgi:RNA polymerase sigma-70 factor (ECF subfamily)